MYGKDLYGNRNPLPVDNAAKHLQKAIIALEQYLGTVSAILSTSLLLKLGISACLWIIIQNERSFQKLHLFYLFTLNLSISHAVDSYCFLYSIYWK